jgi:hypothetical protein
MIFIGCSEKSPKVEKVIEPVVKIESVQVATPQVETIKNEVVEVVETKTEALRSNETMVAEAKVTKNIASDVPSSCAMWSDGSNICTRVSTTKASCDTNPVANRMVSCLQWQ